MELSNKEELREHNIIVTESKEKFQDTSIAPMHTTEHIINRTMVNMFGCERSKNAHIERKKSKISFILPECPSPQKVDEIMNKVNEVVSADYPVTYDFENIKDLEEGISIEKLPEGTNDTVRIVRIGDYDKCACIGLHVEHTAQIGRVVLLGTNWDEEKKSFRIRYKLENTDLNL